jgi:hypothetical protein
VPVFAIQTAKLNGLGDMFFTDLLGGIEVGEGAGDA